MNEKIKMFEQFSTNKVKIYLAGGWEEWRDAVIDKVDGAIFLDPRITTKKDNWFELETEMIRECDAVIAWITKENQSGFGMTFEMGMAYALNKPYILINEKENVYQWGMQSKGAVANFKTFDEFISWLDKTNWLNLTVK